MRDEAHVGLVDAHAEGHRRRDHHLFRLNERSLVAGANLRLEPGVIGQRRAASRSQLLGNPFGFVAARRVNDPGSRLLREQRLQLAAEPVARPDMVTDVGPVEAGDDQPVLRDT